MAHDKYTNFDLNSRQLLFKFLKKVAVSPPPTGYIFAGRGGDQQILKADDQICEIFAGAAFPLHEIVSNDNFSNETLKSR